MRLYYSHFDFRRFLILVITRISALFSGTARWYNFERLPTCPIRSHKGKILPPSRDERTQNIRVQNSHVLFCSENTEQSCSVLRTQNRTLNRNSEQNTEQNRTRKLFNKSFKVSHKFFQFVLLIFIHR